MRRPRRRQRRRRRGYRCCLGCLSGRQACFPASSASPRDQEAIRGLTSVKPDPATSACSSWQVATYSLLSARSFRPRRIPVAWSLLSIALAHSVCISFRWTTCHATTARQARVGIATMAGRNGALRLKGGCARAAVHNLRAWHKFLLRSISAIVYR